MQWPVPSSVVNTLHRQPSLPSPKMPSGEKTTGGHGGLLNLSHAQVEQKLADLERTSTDPNAASIAETIQAIFLN